MVIPVDINTRANTAPQFRNHTRQHLVRRLAAAPTLGGYYPLRTEFNSWFCSWKEQNDTNSQKDPNRSQENPTTPWAFLFNPRAKLC